MFTVRSCILLFVGTARTDCLVGVHATHRNPEIIKNIFKELNPNLANLLSGIMTWPYDFPRSNFILVRAPACVFIEQDMFILE